MEEIMVVDGIGNVTFSNDVLRVELTRIAPSGEVDAAGELMIPRSSIDAVVNGLVQGVNQINEKLTEIAQKSGSDDANGSTSDDKKEDSNKKGKKK